MVLLNKYPVYDGSLILYVLTVLGFLFSFFFGCREIMVKYGKVMDGLAKDLTRLLAKSYELADPDICKEWPSQFRISKYHFNPETVGKNGLITHTDPGFLTIVHGDDNVGGLEAMDHSSGTYYPINTSPNTLTVNLGDMAKVRKKKSSLIIMF